MHRVVHIHPQCGEREDDCGQARQLCTGAEARLPPVKLSRGYGLLFHRLSTTLWKAPWPPSRPSQRPESDIRERGFSLLCSIPPMLNRGWSDLSSLRWALFSSGTGPAHRSRIGQHAGRPEQLAGAVYAPTSGRGGRTFRACSPRPPVD